MAVIDSQDLGGVDFKVATPTTLGASDTFTVDFSKKQILVIFNDTEGALTPNVVGSAPSATYPVQNAKPVNLSAGLTSGSIAIGDMGFCYLNNNAAYLAGSGTVTVTGGYDAKALIVEL